MPKTPAAGDAPTLATTDRRSITCTGASHTQEHHIHRSITSDAPAQATTDGRERQLDRMSSANAWFRSTCGAGASHTQEHHTRTVARVDSRKKEGVVPQHLRQQPTGAGASRAAQEHHTRVPPAPATAAQWRSGPSAKGQPSVKGQPSRHARRRRHTRPPPLVRFPRLRSGRGGDGGAADWPCAGRVSCPCGCASRSWPLPSPPHRPRLPRPHLPRHHRPARHPTPRAVRGRGKTLHFVLARAGWDHAAPAPLSPPRVLSRAPAPPPRACTYSDTHQQS